MKAVLMTTTGGPEVLEWRDIPEPEITSSSAIKVRVRAAGVNPVDAKLRQRGVLFPNALPAILGCDGAGEVVEVGEDVSRFKPGDRVWYCHGGLGSDPGSYAEYKVLDEVEAELMPADADFYQAAALPLVLLTAWEALFDRTQLRKGQQILIHAGAGGVGHVAIQLAKWAGARVATTVSDEAKSALARKLGADWVINYYTDDVVTQTLAWTDNRGVAICLDTVGSEVLVSSMALTAYGGDVVTLLEPGADFSWKTARSRNLRVSFELMLTPQLLGLSEARAHQGVILKNGAELFDRGALHPVITEVLPLSEAVQAHRMIEQGHTTGKLVLSLD